MKVDGEGCLDCGGNEVEPATYLNDIDALIVECKSCGRQGEVGPEELFDTDKIWKKWDRPRILAVDLDGTIIRSSVEEWKGPEHFSETHEDMADLVRELHKFDNIWIMIWTCRNDVKAVSEVLQERNIPFDSINNHPFKPKDISRKITYDLLIGDTEVRFDGNNIEEVRDTAFKELVEEEDNDE